MVNLKLGSVRPYGLLAFASILIASSAAWAEKPASSGMCQPRLGAPCEVRVVRSWTTGEVLAFQRLLKPQIATAQRRQEVVPVRVVDSAVETLPLAQEPTLPRLVSVRKPCLSPLCPSSINLGIAY